MMEVCIECSRIMKRNTPFFAMCRCRRCTAEKPYVIIVHHPTMRAFTLNRNYSLICKDFDIYDLPPNFVEKDDGWLPSFDYQRPDWLEGCLYSDFTAYWMY